MQRLLLLVSITTLMGLACVWQQLKIFELQYQNARERTTIRETRKTRKKLREKLAKLRSPDRLLKQQSIHYKNLTRGSTSNYWTPSTARKRLKQNNRELDNLTKQHRLIQKLERTYERRTNTTQR